MKNTNIQLKYDKLKKYIKRFFITLGCFVGFIIIRFLSLLLVVRIFGINSKIWVIVIITTLVSIILISFVLLLIKLIRSKQNRKTIKWYFLADCIIIFLMILCGLTKVGVIPNWFDVEALCPFTGDTSILKGYKCQQISTYTYNCCDSLGFCVEYRNYPDGVKKPIIYLYPTEETEVNVTLGTPEKLSHTYPKYNPERGRNVIAQPDGELKDIETGRKLYALYREGKTYTKDIFDEGFVVKGEDIIPFLEEKLAILGLNEREAEEFIVYWLPQMENNEYNLIRFETKEEQDINMSLNITPKPDTVIRVMMDWKAIDEPVDISEQQLVTQERKGFTVVEWGGSPRN